MAKIAISIKIDVSKIDKARLFKGAKGTYLDASAFIELDSFDEYGNSGMITQAVSKEEKANGVMGNILGNTKVFWRDSAGNQQAQLQASPYAGNPKPAIVDNYDDDIPFS